MHPARLPAAVVAALALVTVPAAADATKAACVESNTKAQDLRRDGKLAAAHDELRACAAPACPALVRDDCTRRLDEVERAQPTIAFEVKDASGSDVAAVKVTVDGRPLADRLDGTALVVDPGEHSFAFTIGDQPPVTRVFMLTEGEKGRRERVLLVATPPAPPAAATTAAVTAPPAATTLASEAPAPGSGGPGTQGLLALVAGGVGVVGIGVGTVFGVVAISKKSSAQTACPGACGDQGGVDMWNDAASAGNVSTVAFIVGAVGLAGSAALWFTRPGQGKATTQVGAGPGGIQLRGTW